jgi:manganese/zinc/iron transport system permease protein
VSLALEALLLRAGYNAALVAVGASLLGAAAGYVGAFLLLRKRALISDAISHATLPGVCIAFMVMTALGGDGRSLGWLMVGSALSAGLGLLLVQWMVRRTRLSEDAAIGAVLSVFFGFGVVLLTIIQSIPAGRQAGLQSFLLGSTAGMLLQDAVLILCGGLVAVLGALALRRRLTLVAFDAEFAASTGVSVPRSDLALMGLVLGVTVIGLKLVGLILIVALLIIPPVAARFWTERSGLMALIAAGIGAVSAYIGASLSAALPQAPTGPLIVLTSFAIFVASLLFAPARGAVARLITFRRFQRRVHLRQGLLALARHEPVHDRLTLKLLRSEGLIRADGVETDRGASAAGKALDDEKRWEVARSLHPDHATDGRHDGLLSIESVLTRDEIDAIDRRIGAMRHAGGG